MEGFRTRDIQDERDTGPEGVGVGLTTVHVYCSRTVVLVRAVEEKYSLVNCLDQIVEE